MFFEKIKNKKSGIVLYGITPPKSQNSFEKNQEIADKTVERIKNLDIDGLVIYDLQDETSRTSVERPFPFLNTLDPVHYAQHFLHETEVPKIIYRSVGKYSKAELASWIGSLPSSNYSTVFVGAPSKNQVATMKLSDAYKLWLPQPEPSKLGGVTIFERHHANKSEHLRIINKMETGCSYFISQCVFNIGFAKDVLSDLYFYCLANNLELPTIVFTLTTCGSKKTLDFMDWLGIHCPVWLRNELNNSHDILNRSVDLSFEIAEEIVDFCIGKSIPFGINVESVSVRKEEIEASLHLLKKVNNLFYSKGIKKEVGIQGVAH